MVSPCLRSSTSRDIPLHSEDKLRDLQLEIERCEDENDLNQPSLGCVAGGVEG